MEENVERDMEEVTELDLMKEFMELTNKPLQENELTISMFMEYMDVTRNRARYMLAKYEEKGILKSRKFIMNGTSVNAYSPAKGTWKEAVEKLKNQE